MPPGYANHLETGANVNMDRLACEELFGQERGAEVSNFVERITGMPCPCLRGEVCPLIRPKEDAA